MSGGGPKRVEPPVFYPTMAEMRGSFEAYIESIEDQLEEFGIGRIVPPAGWTPRAGGYDDIDFTVNKAITQVRLSTLADRGNPPRDRPFRFQKSPESDSSSASSPPSSPSQHATGRKGLFRTLLVEQKPLSIKDDFKPMASKPENQPSKAALEDETHSTLEREFWKKVTYNPPTYCADVAGTLFDGNNWGWDVSKLDSLLSRTLKKRGITLDGVNSSYLYFGMWRALFAWHTEDMDLYSVNYLHYGAPKFWYAIAPEDRERFEILAQGMVPEMWRACPEFLRHKELLISPTLLEQNGIPFTRMMQRPGEFVVTYPGSYHSGFNTGYNCAESCNFATKAWVEIGEEAGVCECVPDAVSLDMSIFDDDATICRRVDHEKRRATNNDDSDDSDSDDETPLARKIETCAKREKTVKTEATTGKRARDATSHSASASGKAAKMRRAGGRVLVPEGWSRAVVMRGPDGPARGGPGRPKSAAGDRDTYYTSPDGVTLKSKYEVNKYLSARPEIDARARDFFFETKPEDVPPARLVAPGTPSPASSAGEEKENAGRAKVAKKPAKDARNPPPFASAPKTKHAKGTGARDATGKLLSPNATSRGMGAFLRETLRGASPSGKSTALKPLSHAERANAQPVDADRFNAWKSGGLLEGAVAKVLRRAGNVGKSIRGSSLVLQVEQALGVGSGALRGHGSDIRDIAKAKQPKAR